MKREVKYRIGEEVKELAADLLFLYDPEDKGPGTSFRQILFDPAFSSTPTIAVCADLDQFVIDTPEALEGISRFVGNVEKEGALFAIGSRDVPVRLATHKRNSEIRIIHELFNSLAIGPDKLRIGEQRSYVTPAYATIGESTSGFYAMNFSHPDYPELTKNVLAACQAANMNGFASDYYVALLSPSLGKLGKGYVQTRENKFYSDKTEEEEFENVKRLIQTQTSELAKTNVRDLLLAALKDKNNAKLISQFYAKDDVKFVRKLMMDSLTEYI